jgi:hypothetical protein
MQQRGEPTHSIFGTPLSEWLWRVPNELPRDAVGLWQIAPVLEHHFGLSGAALESALRQAVHGLLAAGAMPVEGSDSPGRWALRSDLAASGEAGVDRVVQYWRELGREPNVGDIWFALPSQVA